jgi:hypothetical protein
VISIEVCGSRGEHIGEGAVGLQNPTSKFKKDTDFCKHEYIKKFLFLFNRSAETSPCNRLMTGTF